MIDDDSNELIPFEGGDGDADASTGNNNPDDTQSVTIIQDEQGIVFLGDAGTIDLWLKDEGFGSKAFTAKAIQTVSSASKGAQTVGNAMAESGVAKYGKNCKKGPFQAGVVRQPNGHIIKHLQFTQPGQLNPAMLTGISGVMAQMALEQAVSEITDYLKEIDAKLDDLLRDQKDQTVSKLAGISHMIDETMLIYQQVGSISETTWSKMSGCPQDIATIQALTEKVEREQDPKQVRPLTQQIRQEIHQWLGMLASAVRMQDQVSCIELARVCQEEPEQLEAHKKGIVLARNKRLAEIEQSLNALGRQLETKAGIVGGKVLLNPYSSPHAIANIESITSDLNAFASTLQLEHIHLHVEDGPTWIEAAGKAVDDTGKALQNARQQTAHAVQDAGSAIAKGAQGTGVAVAKGMQDAGNQAAHIAQDAGDAITKCAQDVGAGIADGVQQFGKGIADGLKQLPEIKLTKFGWGKK
ncbi:MAG: hypothetical protein BHV59_07840 [Bifidobacterium sp. 56_9_plus]|nr:MAG: hypothetical protein BHV59_07840 [Bifidobacterium sp. 56_9_plus]